MVHVRITNCFCYCNTSCTDTPPKKIKANKLTHPNHPSKNNSLHFTDKVSYYKS